MRKWQLIYFILAAVWLIITVSPIPKEYINHMELVRIALVIVIVICGFLDRNIGDTYLGVNK